MLDLVLGALGKVVNRWEGIALEKHGIRVFESAVRTRLTGLFNLRARTRVSAQALE